MSTAYKHITYPNTDMQVHLAMHQTFLHERICLAFWDLHLYTLFPQEKIWHQKLVLILTKHTYSKTRRKICLSHTVLLWLGYSNMNEVIHAKVRGRALVRKFNVSNSTQDALICMDTTSYISSCWYAKMSESQQNHNSICVSNLCFHPPAENYFNSYSVGTLLMNQPRKGTQIFNYKAGK